MTGLLKQLTHMSGNKVLGSWLNKLVSSCLAGMATVMCCKL